MKLLIVDDEKSMQEMASHILLSSGYEVTTASSGDEAVPLIRQNFDIVLTDLDMPGSMNGLDLMRLIRSSSNTDVIIMTGFPELSTAIQAVRDGAYDYLVKPFSPDTLRMSIDRCSHKRSLSTELEREKKLRAELDDAYIALSQMQKVKNLFGQFTTPEVAKYVMENTEDFWKKGQRRDVTILFADIRQFTPYAASVSPEEAVRSLNEIYEVLVGAIQDEGGMVNKFMGDGLMAVFGAPVELNDHALHATRAALKAMTILKLSGSSGGEGNSLKVGIALNSGDVIAGCLGAKGRTEYSVIGSAVNLAARIEKVCGPEEILLGPETAQRVADLYDLEAKEPQRLAGFQDPVVLSALLGPKGAQNRT